MRHFLLFMTAMLLTCCSSDCEVKAETNQYQANMAKTLIVYYSYTGNCKAIVNNALGTQLLNAIKANPNDASSYPAIDPVTVSIDDYQNIIIVTPLWWSQMAAIMQTFLFQNRTKLAGKTVAMIVSSHSSGISGVVADAQRLLPNVTWAGDALWINASNHSNRNSLIENWLPTQNFHSSTTGISHVKSDVKKSKVYTLQGTLALVGQKGIVIKDGKKVAIK